MFGLIYDFYLGKSEDAPIPVSSICTDTRVE